VQSGVQVVEQRPLSDKLPRWARSPIRLARLRLSGSRHRWARGHRRSASPPRWARLLPPLVNPHPWALQRLLSGKHHNSARPLRLLGNPPTWVRSRTRLRRLLDPRPLHKPPSRKVVAGPLGSHQHWDSGRTPSQHSPVRRRAHLHSKRLAILSQKRQTSLPINPWIRPPLIPRRAIHSASRPVLPSRRKRAPASHSHLDSRSLQATHLHRPRRNLNPRQDQQQEQRLVLARTTHIHLAARSSTPPVPRLRSLVGELRPTGASQ
jgi:hypothetical protein